MRDCYWDGNKPISDLDIADCVAQRFSYRALRYLKLAGIKCSVRDTHAISIHDDLTTLYINIKKWKRSWYAGGHKHGPALRIRTRRKQQLGYFKDLADEYSTVTKIIVELLPQPIAEEIVPEITFYWKIKQLVI